MNLPKKILVNQKLHVFYRRVSTENQSLEMQVAADKKYWEVLDDNEYLEFNELGISANKVKMKDRVELMKVIDLIKQGRVETLYVYDRTRLARNFYEYLELVDLFNSYGINIVFTTTDPSYAAFSGQFMVEGFNAILIEEEGKAIARRIADVHRKLPNQKLGYRIEKKDGKKEYFLEENSKELLKSLFLEAEVVKNTEEFLRLITKYSSFLRRQVVDVIRILSDSFYTAHEQLEDSYSPLSYVEALVELEQFKKVQETIEPFIRRFKENIQSRVAENVLVPSCGVCHSKMKYKKDKLGESGVYTCSNKHRKVAIKVDVYNESIKEVIDNVMNNLNDEELKSIVIQFLNGYISKYSEEYEALSNQIAKVELEIAMSTLDKLMAKNQLLASLNKLKEKRKDIETSCLIMEHHKVNIRYLAKQVEKKSILTNEQMMTLSSMLINNVFVHDSSITFQLYFNEYLDKRKILNELDGVSA